MKVLQPKQSRLTVAAMTILLLIVPFCAAYLFYFFSQRSFYTKRDFRVLENVGSHISTRIDNLTDIVKSIGDELRDKHGPDERGKALDELLERVKRYGY